MLQIVIISLLVENIVVEGLPQKTNKTFTWRDALKECKERFAGSEYLKDCDSANCRVNVSDSSEVMQQPFGNYEYWVNGYVKRSPGYVYTGCYSMNRTAINFLHWNDYFQRGQDRTVTIYSNSPSACLRSCDSTDVVYLNRNTCLCKTFDKIQPKPSEDCDISCSGDTEERCGGNIIDNFYFQSTFSGYTKFTEGERAEIKKIISQDMTSRKFVSENCFVVHTQNNTNSTILEQNCKKSFRYICETYNEKAKVYKQTCSFYKSTWHDARRKCRLQKQYLWPRTRNTVINCMNENEMYWFGQHIKEDIVWDTKYVKRDSRWNQVYTNLPEGASCLVLDYNNGTYSLELQNCYNRKFALCYPSGSITFMEFLQVAGPIAAVVIVVAICVRINEKEEDRRVCLYVLKACVTCPCAACVGGLQKLYYSARERRWRRRRTQSVQNATNSYTNKSNHRNELKTISAETLNLVKTEECEECNKTEPKLIRINYEQQNLTATPDKTGKQENTTEEESDQEPNTDFSPTSDGTRTVIG